MCQYLPLHDLARQSANWLTSRGSSTDNASFEKAIKSAHDTFQRIDSIVLNAGTLDPVGKITTSEISLDAWKTSFDVNFFSLVSALRVCVPLLNANETDVKGRVIFVSSGAATSGTYGWGPYNAGKAAMNSLCRCVKKHHHTFSSCSLGYRTLAQEEPGLVCIAVRPGKVDTAVRSLC